MNLTPVDSYEKEHEDWIRHAAVDLSIKHNRYSRDLGRIIADAEVIADFIFNRKSGDVIPFLAKPEEGGEA